MCTLCHRRCAVPLYGISFRIIHDYSERVLHLRPLVLISTKVEFPRTINEKVCSILGIDIVSHSRFHELITYSFENERPETLDIVFGSVASLPLWLAFDRTRNAVAIEEWNLIINSASLVPTMHCIEANLFIIIILQWKVDSLFRVWCYDVRCGTSNGTFKVNSMKSHCRRATRQRKQHKNKNNNWNRQK